jgi:hypothetical protein
MGFSLGGSREKAKTTESGTSEYNPYAPTKPSIDRLITDMNSWYDNPNNMKFMGGYDPNNFITDYSDAQKGYIEKGKGNIDNLDPNKFITSDALLNSYMAGNPMNTGAKALELLAGGTTGTYLDQLNNRGANAFNMMNVPTDQYLKDTAKSMTDMSYNSAMSKMAKQGRYDPNSASFSNEFANTLSENLNPIMQQFYSDERGREFKGASDEIVNRYNAGTMIADNMYKAGTGMSDAEINIARGMPSYHGQIAGNYDDAIQGAFGWDQKYGDMTDAQKQIQVAEMMYNQGVPLDKLTNYYNTIMGIATGFPMMNQQGTTSSKKTGFGGGFSFG